MSRVCKHFSTMLLWIFLVLQLVLIHSQDEELRYSQVPVCAPVSPAGTPGNLIGCVNYYLIQYNKTRDKKMSSKTQ